MGWDGEMTWLEQFHHDSKYTDLRLRLSREYETEAIRKAIRDAGYRGNVLLGPKLAAVMLIRKGN